MTDLYINNIITRTFIRLINIKTLKINYHDKIK